MNTTVLKPVIHGVIITIMTLSPTWAMEKFEITIGETVLRSNDTVADLPYLKLTTLPPGFGKLTALEKLDLRANQLTILPLELGNLTNLNSLYLDDNKLSTLPHSFCNLTTLKKLHLSGNPLQGDESQWAKNLHTAKLNEFRLFYTTKRDFQIVPFLLILSHHFDKGSPFAHLPQDIIAYLFRLWSWVNQDLHK